MERHEQLVHEKIHAFARGFVHLRKQFHEELEGESPDEALEITHLVHNSLKFLLSRFSDIDLPMDPSEMEQNPARFVENHEARSRSKFQRIKEYTSFTSAAGKIMSFRRDIRQQLLSAEAYDETFARQISDALLTQPSAETPPIYVDLQLHGAELAEYSGVFRDQFYEAVACMPFRGSVNFNMGVPMVTADYLYRDHGKDLDPITAAELTVQMNGWYAKHQYCQKTGGFLHHYYRGQKAIRWLQDNFSSDEAGEISQEMRTDMMAHANPQALYMHDIAAFKLNSAQNDGAEHYYVIEMIRLLVKKYELQQKEGTVQNRRNLYEHQALISQQISVLIHSLETSYASFDGISGKEMMEEALSMVAMSQEELAPLISDVLTKWERHSRTGKEQSHRLERRRQEEVADTEQVQLGKKIQKNAEAQTELEKRKIGMVSVMKEESNSYGWELPLEFLEARAKEKRGIVYHRSSSLLSSGKLSNAQVFEMSMVQEMARKHDMRHWFYTDANSSICTMTEWARSQDMLVTSDVVMKSIEQWLTETSDPESLRVHLIRNELWPESAEIFEEGKISSCIQYWQAVCKARLELEADGIEPTIQLSFGTTMNQHAKDTGKQIKKLDGKYIEIGGRAAEYTFGRVRRRRQDHMTIEHVIASDDYKEDANKDTFSVEWGFRYGAYVIGQKEGNGFGAPHKTSAIEYKGNMRLQENFQNNEALEKFAPHVFEAFTMQGTGEWRNEPVDYVLFSPGGSEGVFEGDYEDANHTWEPAGSGGYGGGGGGLATL